MRDVCADFEVELKECNGEGDHVHLVVNFPPKVAVSSQEFPELERHYWRAKRLWSGSYFAASVGGTPLDVVRRYIEGQQRPS
nr:transposase [Glycomyces albidus]